MNKDIEPEKSLEEEAMERKGEKVILAVKPHPWFFSVVLWYVIASVAIILVLTHYKISSGITNWVILALAIVVILKFVRDYYCWSKTYFLLTTERIISYEQNGFFSQSMKEGSLKDILFISYEKNGVTNHIINRGTIYIRTSGVVEEEITLKNIPNPYEIEQKITEIKKIYTGEDLRQTQEEKPKKQRPIIR